MLYLALSPLAGARKVEGEESETMLTSEKQTDVVETKTEKSQEGRDWFSIIAGIIALTALAGSFIIPLSVFVMGAESYTDNLAFMKKSLIWFMIIYFISGMYYIRSKD